MSWSYDYFNVSGYSTGVTGIQINEAVYLQVSGLTYDGTTFNSAHLEWLTGIGFIASGNISTPVSGIFVFNPDFDHWEAVISITDAAEVGNTGAGTYEWYWNSGGSFSDADVSTGMWIFANAGADRWNVITYANGSVDNADAQHSHAGAADDLGDHEATQILDMNSFKITGLANGSVSTDAMAYGQFVASALNHNDLANIGAGDINHITDAQVSALHSQPAHNSLAGLNDGTSYEHISAAQVSALHSQPAHNSLGGLNDGTSYEHITQTQKTALHAIYTLAVHNNTHHNPDYSDTSHTHSSIYITEAEVNTLLAIGSANKQWVTCVLGGMNFTEYSRNWDAIRNRGADDMDIVFDIPLPYTLPGGHNLVLTQFRIGITDADIDDYVDRIRIYSYTLANPPVGATLYTSDINRVTPGVYTSNHADKTVGGNYSKINYLVDCVNTNALELDVASFEVEYYYT